jgi:hypothetical protein
MMTGVVNADGAAVRAETPEDAAAWVQALRDSIAYYISLAVRSDSFCFCGLPLTSGIS